MKGRFGRLDAVGDLPPPDLDADAQVLTNHLGEGVAADDVPPEQESDQNEDDFDFDAAFQEVFCFDPDATPVLLIPLDQDRDDPGDHDPDLPLLPLPLGAPPASPTPPDPQPPAAHFQAAGAEANADEF